ncbi:Nramp family divalent metal transporter [Paludibacterium paludis]|uniref:Divalent metal cation transporter MntH n=1 Tax=Paludibacterium paludis TaxID=1225769 RepID=A0A918UBR3_9NEIS|nr:Nramp family divalent metal transporter [Paludibacterium paludis]GGY27580.1 hypothetical protein GCM10011289_33750 [Paludibacterium paludis]
MSRATFARFCRSPGMRYLGPAFLVSVGYMDPGNWSTAIAAGSEEGHALLWVLVASSLMAWLLQTLSARLGIVTGQDLATASREAYGPRLNRILLALATIAVIATDLAEILGMAIGLHLLFALDMAWCVALTLCDTLLFLLLSARGLRTLESAVIAMIAVVALAFAAQLAIVAPSGTDIVHGMIVRPLDGHALYLAIGIMGATIMPHNLYLHSALVKTTASPDLARVRATLKRNARDTGLALGIAFAVNAAILIVAATAFHHDGAAVGGLSDAHRLFGERFGHPAQILFAVALILCGQSSTLTGALAGQVILEGHGKLHWKGWQRRLVTRAIALVPAFLTIVLAGDRSLDTLLVASQVILSLQLGFAVIPLLRLTGNRSVMGRLRPPVGARALAWAVALFILLLNGKLVLQTVGELSALPGWAGVAARFGGYPAAIAAGVLLAYLAIVRLKWPQDENGQRDPSRFSTSPRIDLSTLRHTSSSP